LALPEAVFVFRDPFLVTVYDDAHSSLEESRWKGIGFLGNALLLSVIFIEKPDNILPLFILPQSRKSCGVFTAAS
jgi:uncharacterized DUF497 family protein